jgi:hypothetical protein
LTILRTYKDSDIDMLRQYFKEQRGVWFKIPVELFKVDKPLFLDSFERLLNRWTDDSIYKYDGLLYLTNHLNILEFLIDNLSLKQSKRIREFCKFKSAHSYVNNEKWKQDLIKLSNK